MNATQLREMFEQVEVTEGRVRAREIERQFLYWNGMMELQRECRCDDCLRDHESMMAVIHAPEPTDA